MRIRAIAAICFFALTNCVPYHYTAKPGASGRIINAQTQHPIAGAHITLTAPGVAGSTVSALDGSFLVPPKQEWGIYILAMDPSGWHVHMTIEAKNYLTASHDFMTSIMGPPVTPLGDIALKQRR